MTTRISYEKLLALPDSPEKFLLLEKKLLKLQHHGADFFRALEEYKRMFPKYRATR